MKIPFLHKSPKERADALMYVAHGDNMWGNSISYEVSKDSHNVLRISGFLSRAPFPRKGDNLLVRMNSGKWGLYRFTENARTVFDPHDLFFGTAQDMGVYWPDHLAPKTKKCDEFIPEEKKSYFLR